MKNWKWRIAAFVVWIVTPLIVVSVSLRGASKADTATNLVSVAILLFWVIWSFATNCFTFIGKIKGLLSQAYNQLDEYYKSGATNHSLLRNAMGNINDVLKELED